MPMTPVEHVAGAIFRAATDPDGATRMLMDVTGRRARPPPQEGRLIRRRV